MDILELTKQDLMLRIENEKLKRDYMRMKIRKLDQEFSPPYHGSPYHGNATASGSEISYTADLLDM